MYKKRKGLLKEMEFESVMSTMEEILESSWKLPMTKGKVILDASEFEELIGKLRLALPEEIKEANKILEKRNIIIENAKKDCQDIYKIAKHRVAEMVEEHEIVKKAKQREAEIMKELKEKTDQFLLDSRDTIGGNLSEIETIMASGLDRVKNARKILKSLRPSLK